MTRSNLFFKIEVRHDPGEPPEKIAEEIRRHLRKLYVVLDAELSHVSAVEE